MGKNSMWIYHSHNKSHLYKQNIYTANKVKYGVTAMSVHVKSSQVNNNWHIQITHCTWYILEVSWTGSVSHLWISLNIQHERTDAVSRLLTHFYFFIVFEGCADKPAGKFNGFESVVSRAALFPVEEQVVVAHGIVGINGVQGVMDLLWNKIIVHF